MYKRQKSMISGSGRRGSGSFCRKELPFGSAVLLILLTLALLTGCSRGPEEGTVYGPSDDEENLYLDLTAEEAEKLEREEKDLPEAAIIDSGYSITQIDESDVYPPKKTDDYGQALPAYLVDFAVVLSNEGNDLAMVWPTVTAVAFDSYGNELSRVDKTIRTYVLPGDRISFGSEMTVRGELPDRISFSAVSEDPDNYYPTEEELNMPSADSYESGEVRVRVLPEYEEQAPSAGRKSSEGLSRGYYYFGELPELSGTIRCSSDQDQEAFVTILYRNGDQILGGETGRVMIPAGKKAYYVLTAAGPVPEDTESFEVSAFSIAKY